MYYYRRTRPLEHVLIMIIRYSYTIYIYIADDEADILYTRVSPLCLARNIRFLQVTSARARLFFIVTASSCACAWYIRMRSLENHVGARATGGYRRTLE